MEYADVVDVARAAIGVADETCMEVRLRAMKSRKCCNDGIVRYGRTEWKIVKSGMVLDKCMPELLMPGEVPTAPSLRPYSLYIVN